MKGKTWSRGTIAHLSFGVNVNLNLSSVDSESDYFVQPYLLVIGVFQTSLMVNNNDLDRNPPIVSSSEVCDTPITNNHGGTNTPTQ